MSGTQLLFQFNRAGPETTQGEQKIRPDEGHKSIPVGFGKQRTRPDQGHKSLVVGASTVLPWAQSRRKHPRSPRGLSKRT